MKRKATNLLFCPLVLALISIPGFAAQMASCAPDFSSCAIPENVLLQLPFAGIAGDVVVFESDGTTISDVFRIFNDLVDTGQGTGLGDLAFLFSSDDSTPLPDPSTFSANAVGIIEDPSGFTQFIGNGTDYVLNAPEPGTLGFFGVGLLVLGAIARKQLSGLRRSLVSKQLFVIVGMAVSGCFSGFGQGLIDLASGTTIKVAMKFDKPIGFGPKQAGKLATNADPPGLAFYTANYTSLGGKQLPFNIVGTDPSLGANTTTVPTVIVPLKFVFPGAGSPTLDGTNVVTPTVNSPIFLTADYTVGGTDLGVTQFGDAIQRGEFWNLPGFSQAGYHVLLGTPAIASTTTITVPSGKGNAFRLRDGGLIGVLDNAFFDQVLAALLPAYSANQLPIFTTDNVFLAPNGAIQNCCIFGFHASQGPPIATAQTWIYAAFTDPGTFRGDVVVDVQPLSHEVAEWLNDPFVGTPLLGGINLIPPAVLPGQGGCLINFETGDPLEAPPVTFTQTTNGTTNHQQDEVFLPWFLHTTPSFSVNGGYTFLSTFPTFSTLCGPG